MELGIVLRFDTHRTHSTDRYRAQAKPKYGTFAHPLPDVEWPTLIPETAMLPIV